MPRYPASGEPDENEEFVYQLLCALTSPSLVNMDRGAFSTTPGAGDPIYTCFKGLIRYAGLAVNYVDHHWGRDMIAQTSRHINADGAITGIGASSSMMYVLESDVLSITNARALWFERLKWMQSTQPTRLVIDNIAAGGNLGTAAITIGANGSIIKNVTFQGYQCGIRRTDTTTQFLTMNVNTLYRSASADYNNHWMAGEIMIPIEDLGGVAVYDLAIYSTNPTLGYTAFAVAEKYDVPAWWI